MSMKDLKAALSQQTPGLGVVVSEPLFHELWLAQEIEATVRNLPLPADALAREIAARMGQSFSSHLEVPWFTLKNHNKATLLRDVQVGLTLADTGVGSFQIR